MTETVLVDLHNKAQEFGSIARLVNESSRVRKAHTDEAINLIKQSIEISDILNHEFEIISRADRTMRVHDTMTVSTCRILRMNVERQREIIEKISKGLSIDAALLRHLDERAAILERSISRAIEILDKMTTTDDAIILLDNLIIHRRQALRESMDFLKKLTLRILEDAENAIRGSSSNLNRGLQLVEELGRVREYISEGNREALEKLAEEANTGWNIAAAVNRSSMTQLAFAEHVNAFTEKLHEDTLEIRDLVMEKHQLFQNNLERSAELAVILSLEIKDYLAAEDIAASLKASADDTREIRFFLDNLKAYIAIACRDIQSLSSLNFDMTDAINLNAELESKSIELTGMKLEYFDRIREEVRSMTEATRYPIEGSKKNIENGKMLESYVRSILAELS